MFFSQYSIWITELQLGVEIVFVKGFEMQRIVKIRKRINIILCAKKKKKNQFYQEQ